ncbi:hypothetical protein [Clostridium sporogenes]|uniref:hypothetical protein n=1 Tax=Clostridium sporogenes TaxID=1509 RepID=UPI0006650898|nr:hypothetical protein [Clostridium sporogenes]
MEKIKLLKIEYEYSVFISTEGIESEILTGYTIKFNYKRLKQCKICIGTNEELSIEEIKRKILSEIKR